MQYRTDRGRQRDLWQKELEPHLSKIWMDCLTKMAVCLVNPAQIKESFTAAVRAGESIQSLLSVLAKDSAGHRSGNLVILPVFLTLPSILQNRFLCELHHRRHAIPEKSLTQFVASLNHNLSLCCGWTKFWLQKFTNSSNEPLCLSVPSCVGEGSWINSSRSQFGLSERAESKTGIDIEEGTVKTNTDRLLQETLKILAEEDGGQADNSGTTPMEGHLEKAAGIPTTPPPSVQEESTKPHNNTVDVIIIDSEEELWPDSCDIIDPATTTQQTATTATTTQQTATTATSSTKNDGKPKPNSPEQTSSQKRKHSQSILDEEPTTLNPEPSKKTLENNSEPAVVCVDVVSGEDIECSTSPCFPSKRKKIEPKTRLEMDGDDDNIVKQNKTSGQVGELCDGDHTTTQGKDCIHVPVKASASSIVEHEDSAEGLTSETKVMLGSFREALVSNTSNGTAQLKELWEYLALLNTRQVALSCEHIGLSDLHEESLVTLTESLCNVNFDADPLRELLVSCFRGKLLDLTSHASHPMEAALTSVMTFHPRVTIDLLIEVLLESQAGEFQCGLFHFLCQEAVPRELITHVISQLSRPDLALTSHLIHILLTCVNMHCDLDPDCIASFVRAVCQASDSLCQDAKFGQLLLAFVTKYTDKISPSDGSNLHLAISVNKSTFKKALARAAAKLVR